MKYSQLIDKCVELIDSFDEDKMTPDSHAEQFLSQTKCEDTERVFMKQIFYGCERYRGFLKVSNNAIFTQFSGSTNRKNDYTFFAIFTYLICFRMDELPFNEFKKIILSQDQVKINVLFGFIFNFQMLRNLVFDQWQEHLELEYLEMKLMPKLAERKEKCDELIAKVSENATGKRFEAGGSQDNIDDMRDLKEKKKTTIVQEFNLTKPRPKLIPQVEKIEIGFKANPLPKTTNDLKVIEENKKERRKEIQDNITKYYEQNKKKQQFQLQTSKRPSNLPRIKEQVEKLQTKQIKKLTAKPMPKYTEIDVKLNVAAILREQRKLKQKIEEQQRRVKDLEVNMRDESEYESWKKEMKEKDKYEEMEAQQRRKIEMELAREAAIDACQDKIQEKKNLVEDMKQIASELKQEREKLEVEDLQSKKKLVGEVQESKENVKIEQEKVLQQNKKIHDDEKEERRRILQKKKQQEKIEMQKKKQLIQEIRELETKIKVRPKQQIEYVSIGLLEEMTLQQLQQRLTSVKRERREEEEKRRQSNIKKKEEFKESLNQKKDSIMVARGELAKQKEQERKKKKEEIQREQQRLAQVKTKSMNEYKKKQEKKLQQRRMQKDKLAKEIKQTQQRRMFLMQGQAQQQANAFMNLQTGEERQILERQNAKLMQEYKHQVIKEGEMRILADKNKREVQKKIQFNKLYNEQEEVDNRLAEQLQQEDVAAKALKYQQVRTFEQKHNENMTKSNPYKSKIAEMSLSKSKGVVKK